MKSLFPTFSGLSRRFLLEETQDWILLETVNFSRELSLLPEVLEPFCLGLVAREGPVFVELYVIPQVGLHP